MSVNNLLDSGNPAESWKALRLASLVVDSDFSLKDDAVKGLSGSVNAINIAIATSPILGVVMDYSHECDILPKEITWPLASANIAVANDGIYSINIHFSGAYKLPSIPSVDTKVNLVFENVTDAYTIASTKQIVNANYTGPVELSINRIAKLQKGKVYNIIFLQDSNDTIEFDGGDFLDSYINIVKLF